MKYATLLLILASFFSWTLSGQLSEERIITQCEVCYPNYLVTADLDQDLDQDLLAMSRDSDKIFWFQNDGTGTFSPPITITTKVEFVLSIAASDLDKDGRIDIISTSINKVAWYKNLGNGLFSDQILISNRVEFPKAVIAVDFNLDGDVDLITAGNNIVWFKNQGGGIFSNPLNIATEVQSISVYAEDMDNDADLDILYHGNSFSDRTKNGLWYLKNHGNNFFPQIQRVSIEEHPGHIAGQDIDNDGDIDIVSSFPAIYWFKNIGNGEFDVERIDRLIDPDVILTGFDLPEDHGSISVFSIDDINGDSIPDIILSPKTALRDSLTNIAWYENDGLGNFGERNIISNLPDAIALVTVDIDGDKDKDIIVSSTKSDSIIAYKNDGFGNFIEGQAIYQSEQDWLSAITNADLDNDGDIDIIASDSRNHTISWYENHGFGGFTDQHIISNNVQSARDVQATDIDQDGLLDVLSVSFYDNKIVWYKNLGQGLFSDEIILSTSSESPLKVFAEDVDNDQKIDIVLLSYNNREETSNISWYKNITGNSFSDIQRLASFDPAIYGFNVKDINNDNRPDIIFFVTEENGIVWLKNNGNGNFIQRDIRAMISPANGPFVFDLLILDVDNDGKLDIAYIDEGNSGRFIVWHKNLGNDNFEFQGKIPATSYSAFPIIALDIDEDGDQDIITNSSTSNLTNKESGFYLFENLGGVSFEGRRLTDIEGHLLGSFLTVADIDNDLDKDIVYGDRDKIAWFEINKTEQLNFPTVESLAFWDLNENGQFDPIEEVLTGVPIVLNPSEVISSFTSQDGYTIFPTTFGTYTLNTRPSKCLELTTPDSYTFSTSENNRQFSYEFGFKLTSDFQHTQTRITSSPSRCGFQVPFHLSIVNDGCSPVKGQYGLVLDSLVSFIDASIMPSVIRGDTLFWDHQTLIHGDLEKVRIDLQMPSFEFIGSFLNLQGLSYIQNTSGQQELVSAYEYTSEIRCAYDPNDKLVTPQRASSRSREFDQNYTLFEETLEYTVRFQNTGNDTAFTVVIQDQLAASLDWSTFQPIVASHDYETLLDDNGLVTFTFSNILLPDSTINEPLSHGFITYTIAPQQNLQENTLVENTAAIFFDFNPPIITNTTQNIFVSMLPTTTSVEDIRLPQNIHLYPNPFQNQLIVDASNLSHKEDYQLQFFDITGRLYESFKLTTTIPTAHWQGGMYIYQLVNADGVVIENGKVVK